ncbi:MAG TPA: hypothetical protein VKS25_15790 [Solirubrobacteraceae bacterium]|nr:hypothetical protein [Solirubrobacteraceae bacterium]
MRLSHEHALLDTYGLPHRLPVVFRIVILIVLLPGVGVAIWLLAPHTPAVVALLSSPCCWRGPAGCGGSPRHVS